MLLREMQIQNPTAIMIAKSAIAQDDVTGYALPLVWQASKACMRVEERPHITLPYTLPVYAVMELHPPSASLGSS